MNKHIHHDLIVAWANGAKIQHKAIQFGKEVWLDTSQPYWNKEGIYRIKPEPKPDVLVNVLMEFRNSFFSPRIRCSWDGEHVPEGYKHNLDQDYNHIRYTFDGETGKLKAVSLIGE